MNSLSLLVLALSLSSQQPAEARWYYPADGPTSQAEHSVGKAGDFRSYATVTKDSPEKVALWYAKRLGLGDDHALVKLANVGFRQIKTAQEGNHIVVRDTDVEKMGGLIAWTLSTDGAHVHILVRPENDSTRDISISIVQLSSGTSISVVQSVSDL
jgi:hypothetical protein